MLYLTHYQTLKRGHAPSLTRYPLSRATGPCALSLAGGPWRIDPFLPPCMRHPPHLELPTPSVSVGLLGPGRRALASPSSCYYNAYSWPPCLTAVSLNSQCAAHSLLPSVPAPPSPPPVRDARVWYLFLYPSLVLLSCVRRLTSSFFFSSLCPIPITRHYYFAVSFARAHTRGIEIVVPLARPHLLCGWLYNFLG